MLTIGSYSPRLAAPVAPAPSPAPAPAPAAPQDAFTLGQAAKTTLKRTVKLPLAAVAAVGLGAATVVYCVCFGAVSPFVGGAIGAIGGIGGGLTGKAGDKDSVSNGRIGALVHNNVHAKTGSKVLAGAVGAVAGGLGDGAYMAVDIPVQLVGDFAGMFGGGLSAIGRWLHK